MHKLLLEVDPKVSGAEIYEKGSPKLDALRTSSIDKYTICQKIFTMSDKILAERVSYLSDPSRFAQKIRAQYAAILSTIGSEDLSEVPPQIADIIKKSASALNILSESDLSELGKKCAENLKSKLSIKCVFSTLDQWRAISPTSPNSAAISIDTNVYLRLGPKDLILRSGKTILKNETEMADIIQSEILSVENHVIGEQLLIVLQSELRSDVLDVGRVFTSPEFLALTMLKSVYRPLTLQEYRSELLRMPETKSTILSYVQVTDVERQVGLDPVGIAYAYACTLINNGKMLTSAFKPDQLRAIQIRLDTSRGIDDYLREMLKSEHIRMVLLGLQRYINATASKRGADWREDVMKSNLFSSDELWLALILPLIPGTKESLNLVMQVAKAETGGETTALAERWMRLAGLV